MIRNQILRAVVVCCSASILTAYVIHAQRKANTPGEQTGELAPSSKDKVPVFAPSSKQGGVFNAELKPGGNAPAQEPVKPAPGTMILPGSKSFSPAVEIKAGTLNVPEKPKQDQAPQKPATIILPGSKSAPVFPVQQAK